MGHVALALVSLVLMDPAGPLTISNLQITHGNSIVALARLTLVAPVALVTLIAFCGSLNLSNFQSWLALGISQ